LGIGDWGLGIGDWGLGPIPNPQSPTNFSNNIKLLKLKKYNYLNYILIKNKFINGRFV